MFREQFQSGKLPQEDYLQKREEYEQALTDQYVYSKLELQCSRILNAQARGETAHLLYDTGWLMLFENNSDLLLYAFLLLFFCGSYTMEYTSRFDRTASVTVRGMRAIRRTKRLVALSIGGIFASAFFAADTALLHASFPLSDALYSASGILVVPIPLWCALLMLALTKLLIGIAFALCVNSLSRFLGKPYLVFPIGALIGLLLI